MPELAEGQRQDSESAQPAEGEDGQQAQAGKDQPEGGRNRFDGQQAPVGTERVQRPVDDSDWAKLPEYAGFLKHHGGVPDVPARYKRLVEAYKKRAHSSQRPR